MFEGITYCDYARVPFVCKPHEEMYEKAEVEAKAPSIEDCYFVGTRHFFLSYHSTKAGPQEFLTLIENKFLNLQVPSLS
jgi:hypothetical protein